MLSVINIYNLKINSILSNGFVNIGEVFYNSYMVYLKFIGMNFFYGDVLFVFLKM